MRRIIYLLAITLFVIYGCTEDPEEEETLLDENGFTENMFSEWPSYDPTIHYDFRDEYPEFDMPMENLPYNGGNLDWTMEDGWWSFFAGTDANSLVKEADVQRMLDQLNADFQYLRDEMGWPPDMAVQNGYRSAVFLYGSGLSTDNASNTETGGWQSWVTINQTSWPIVLLSYYPIYCFDPECPYNDKYYNTHAVTHEGIHTMFSSMPGRNNKAWFHEGCNCWLQAAMELERSGSTDYSTLEFGWLSAGTVIAPFMPIECYGGWLTDGSFGGPNYEGMNNNTRYILGGVQYSELFPTFLAENLGYNSLPWIWQNCKGHVLSGMGMELGQAQMERLLQEYRAKVCLSDFGRYEQAMQKTYKDYMGKRIYAEYSTAPAPDWTATPYSKTTMDEEGWLIPDDETLPGWTGANYIPLTVTGDEITVSFDPLDNNMSCQLCYRTADEKTVYCDPVKEGDCTISIKVNKPAHDVVFAVICNLDYMYGTVNQRSLRYDYKVKALEGVLEASDIHKPWYKWN